MKYLKRFLWSVVSVILALFVFIYVGSIDTDEVNHRGLMNDLVAVNDADNGFVVIRYTQEESYELFDEAQREALKTRLVGQNWDAAYAEETIDEYAGEITDFLLASEFKDFQFAQYEDPNRLPSYVPVMDMARLAILKSRYHAEAGDLSESIALADRVVYMASQVKSTSNATLISHMIGLAMQYEALRWLNQLALEYPLDRDQLQRLLATVNRMPSYGNDGFQEVFSGEYRFARSSMADMTDASLGERWETYRNEEDYWNMDLDGDWEFGRETIAQELYAFLSALFPRFYMHDNRTLNQLAKKYKKMTDDADAYCSELTLPVATAHENGFTWLALVTPNATANLWDANYGQYFHEYFYRRCFGHAQIESTKVLLALKMYHLDYGKYPTSLEQLKPEYVNLLPIDPFDGSVIRYSNESEWVYSVGQNAEENGGDLSACFVHYCERYDHCKNNPTFPLNPRQCVSGSVEGAACDKPE